MLSMGITMAVLVVIIGKVALTTDYFLDFLILGRVAFRVFTLQCAGGGFYLAF